MIINRLSEEVNMKNILKKIIKSIILFGFKSIKTFKTFKHIFKKPTINGHRRQALSANDLVERRAKVTSRSKNTAHFHKKQSSTTTSKRIGRKTVWWKNKRIISAAVAGVAVITFVLVFALPNDTATQRNISAALTDNKKNLQESVGSEKNNEQTENLVNENTSVEVASINKTDINHQGASVQTENKPLPATPTTTPIPSPIPTTEPEEKPLTPGCNDSRIIDIQQRLMELGYMGVDEPTDYYGYGTEYALQLFQRKHGLQVDGILGDITLEKLFDNEALPYTIKVGDDGTDVVSIQERLKELKYLSTKSTGYFGTDTEKAVKRFQKRNGLHIDGNVGENTREILYSESAKAERSSSSGSGGSSGGSGGSGGGSSGGSGGSSSGPVAVGDPDEASADALVDYALTQLGKKYVRGGKGPNVFDCSGFVYYCLNKVGYKIGYMTSRGWAKCNLPRVDNMKDMKKGDIICFKGHVGIYMGNGKMVDASSSNGKIVTRSNIFNSRYWTRNFICARRVF